MTKPLPLKPCPFCGAQVTYAYEGSHDHIFECNGCFISTTFYVNHAGDEAERAIALWNRRAP